MKPVVDTYAERANAAALVGRASSPGELGAALAIAARDEAMSFVVLRAPLVPTAALVDAWQDGPLAVWEAASREPDAAPLTIVGLGVAHELRACGPDRFGALVTAARALATAGALVIDDDAGTVRRTSLAQLDELARPRFVGGAAFAPGAAERAPWTGFGDAWFALPRWTYVHDGVRAYLVLAVDGATAREPARWYAELAQHRAVFAGQPAVLPQPPVVEVTRASEELWRVQVEAITSAIQHGACSKVVAARTCTVALAGPGRAGALLDTLSDRHPDCARIVVRPPGAGTLIAATPERLVRRTGAVIACDALAGTLRHDSTRPVAAAVAALLASAKDRREHQLVVDAIRGALEAAGATIEVPSATPIEPAVRVLRHVLHLHTPFRATAPHPLHVLELVARLHPTPAVGGTPTPVAIDWIRDCEPVPRGWYASPVGWFDLDGNGELAVAIRSGVLVGPRAHLWAGAGIVAGSDPDRELAETELKLRAMLGALGANERRVPVAASGALR